MNKLAYRSHSSSMALSPGQGSTPGAQRVFQVAEILAWAVMVAGLVAASIVLLQSYILAG